jgi:hypothetical protein
MIQSVHVLIGGQLRMKPPVAGLALELRLPVSRVVHVLLCRALGKELSIARVTFESWTPVAKRIHVLDGGLLAAKLAVARLAFVVIVHVELFVTFRNVGVQSDKKRWTYEFSKSEGWPAVQPTGQQDINVAASSLSKRQVRGQFVYCTIACTCNFSTVHPLFAAVCWIGSQITDSRPTLIPIEDGVRYPKQGLAPPGPSFRH